MLLPYYLADELERVQKRALRIILPGHSYREALASLGCLRVDETREQLCKKVVKGGPLSSHIPPTRACGHDYPLRNSNLFTTIKCRTERYRCSFFPSTIALLNNGKLI